MIFVKEFRTFPNPQATLPHACRSRNDFGLTTVHCTIGRWWPQNHWSSPDIPGVLPVRRLRWLTGLPHIQEFFVWQQWLKIKVSIFITWYIYWGGLRQKEDPPKSNYGMFVLLLWPVDSRMIKHKLRFPNHLLCQVSSFFKSKGIETDFT